MPEKGKGGNTDTPSAFHQTSVKEKSRGANRLNRKDEREEKGRALPDPKPCARGRAANLLDKENKGGSRTRLVLIPREKRKKKRKKAVFRQFADNRKKLLKGPIHRHGCRFFRPDQGREKERVRPRSPFSSSSQTRRQDRRVVSHGSRHAPLTWR